MKPEQRQYQTISSRLGPYLLFQRHEDRLQPDILDVSYVVSTTIPKTHLKAGLCGWVELKTIDHWSKGVPTRLHHLRPGQVNWLNSRGRLSPLVHLLLYVNQTSEWLWIHGSRVDHAMTSDGLHPDGWRSLTDPSCCRLVKLLSA